MDFNATLIDWLSANLDYMVFGILGLMSVILLACIFDRYWVLWRLDVRRYEYLETLQTAVTERLTAIGSIGSMAPYIGLLGTVLGILVTFYELGQAEQIDAQGVMTGLALALKATAAGLFVAIPAMFFYNQFARRGEVLIARWQTQKASSKV